jgi:hypothetical protein
MSAYVNRLNLAIAVEEHGRREEAARAALRTARDRLTPLEDRLSRLLATIPVELQHEGLSLASLQASLRGRWRGNVHPGELGSALRKLGFTRQRQWADDAGFRAVWRSRLKPLAAKLLPSSLKLAFARYRWTCWRSFLSIE